MILVDFSDIQEISTTMMAQEAGGEGIVRSRA
jgi:hypothetical protein